jgi:hypothetical protein
MPDTHACLQCSTTLPHALQPRKVLWWNDGHLPVGSSPALCFRCCPARVDNLCSYACAYVFDVAGAF